MPSTANDVIAVPMGDRLNTAASTPVIIPNTAESTIAETVRAAVYGKRAQISCMTG